MGARDPRRQDQAARGTVALARRRAGFDIACSMLYPQRPLAGRAWPSVQRLPTPRHVDLSGQEWTVLPAPLAHSGWGLVLTWPAGRIRKRARRSVAHRPAAGRGVSR